MKWNTLSLAGHFLSLVLLAMLTAGTEAQTGFGESTTAQTATSTSSTIARLTASDGLPGNALGISVGISSNTIVVGEDCLRIGDNPDCDVNHQGVVYVYRRPQEGWVNATETAKLTASDRHPGDEFGTSVAISGDTIVVGSENGKAYVFVKPKLGWKDMTETAQLTNSTTAEHFGETVAIHKDTIVVGGRGAAFLFVKPETGWASTSDFTAQLFPSDGNPNNFGASLSVYGDTVVVGAPFHDVATISNGIAYVYTKPAAGWTSTSDAAQLRHRASGDPAHPDFFGIAVSVNQSTIAVGVTQAIAANGSQGVVDIFVKPKSGWVNTTQRAEISAPVAHQNFGFAIALRSASLVVSPSGLPNIVYEYNRPTSGWVSTSKPSDTFGKIEAAASASSFGIAVAANLHSTVVGAPYKSVAGNVKQGMIYVFTR